jgi:predicted nucleic acid-binding protein
MERRTVRVFLDSGVILSGLISDRGAPRLILDILSLGLPVLRGVTGRYCLAEIERNIDHRAPAARAVLTQLLPKLNLEVVFMPFLDEIGPFRGSAEEKDLPVIASASIARADYFISGDERLLSRLSGQTSFSARPIRPDEFLKDLLVRVFTGEMPADERP